MRKLMLIGALAIMTVGCKDKAAEQARIQQERSPRFLKSSSRTTTTRSRKTAYRRLDERRNPPERSGSAFGSVSHDYQYNDHYYHPT